MLATSIREIRREQAEANHELGSLWRLPRELRIRDAALTVLVPACDLPFEEPRTWETGLTLGEKLAKLEEVASVVKSYRAIRSKAYAKAWACFCLFPTRFGRPLGPTTFAESRRIQLKLARFGVVDPHGGAIAGVPF